MGWGSHPLVYSPGLRPSRTSSFLITSFGLGSATPTRLRSGPRELWLRISAMRKGFSDLDDRIRDAENAGSFENVSCPSAAASGQPNFLPLEARSKRQTTRCWDELWFVVDTATGNIQRFVSTDKFSLIPGEDIEFGSALDLGVLEYGESDSRV